MRLPALLSAGEHPARCRFPLQAMASCSIPLLVPRASLTGSTGREGLRRQWAKRMYTATRSGFHPTGAAFSQHVTGRAPMISGCWTWRAALNVSTPTSPASFQIGSRDLLDFDYATL